SLSDARGLLLDPDGRGPADQPPPRRDPAGRRPPDPIRGPHAVFPRGGGGGRARHARDDPPAPVRQDRDHDLRQPRRLLRAPGKPYGPRRGSVEAAPPPPPRRLAFDRRP